MEARPFAQPFLKPVNRRLIPRYYEVISNPIDLQTIRDKISRYEYRRADALIKDFELMKSNAVKFNGEASTIAQEAIAIADSVKHLVESSREELSALEEAVEDQMSTKPKKKKKKQGSAKKSATGTTANIKGVEINLGDVPQNFDDDSDSGFEDEMFTGLQDVM
jgi:Bromodomain